MSKQLLNSSDFIALLQQVHGKAMAERVATYSFCDARLPDSPSDLHLQTILRSVVSSELSRARISQYFLCGKDLLPRPLRIGKSDIFEELDREQW